LLLNEIKKKKGLFLNVQIDINQQVVVECLF
jgi:hypothetical protein